MISSIQRTPSKIAATVAGTFPSRPPCASFLAAPKSTQYQQKTGGGRVRRKTSGSHKVFLGGGLLSLTEESLRIGFQMSSAIPATLLGSTVALVASLGRLAAPHFASAPKSSRQALVPIVAVLWT